MWGVPTLEALVPTSGPPGSLVRVEGDVGLASVRWGEPAKTIPSNFLGARYFTVSSDATPGTYPVQLSRSGELSTNIINFTVTDNIFAATRRPRADDATIGWFHDNTDGTFDVIVFVHGANIGTGATIMLNGAAVESFFVVGADAMPEMQAADPTTLGYPITHYGTLFTALTDQPASSCYSLNVRNRDNQLGEVPVTLQLPANALELDSDGDGLTDDWENHGYTVDGVTLDLPGMGADPRRKDLFLEIDSMGKLEGGVWVSHAPSTAAVMQVVDAFKRAPVLNPDHSRGICLRVAYSVGTDAVYAVHPDCEPPAPGVALDHGDHDLPEEEIGLSTCTGGATVASLRASKGATPAPDAYRYAVFAGPGNSCEDPAYSGYALGNNLYVSVEEDDHATTLLHEVGHTLGLTHAGAKTETGPPCDGEGADSLCWLANYNSVMQYGRGYLGGTGADYGLYHGRPSQRSGTLDKCSTLSPWEPGVGGTPFPDFSHGQLRPLDESKIDEEVGLCDGIDVDFDGDGSIASGEHAVDLDLKGGATDTHYDHPDWARLQFSMAGDPECSP